MIEKFTKIRFDKTMLSELKLVNNYWMKMINRAIVGLNKYKKNFSTSNETAILTRQPDVPDYEQMLKEFNHFKEFFDQKYKIIITERKVYNKFSKFINNYILLASYYYFLTVVIAYYQALATEQVEKKVNFVIKLINQHLNNQFQEIIKMIDKIIPNDKYIKYILEQIIIVDNQIFAPQLIIRKISQYLIKLGGAKKLLEKDVFPITRNFYEYILFTKGVAQISQGFLASLNS